MSSKQTILTKINALKEKAKLPQTPKFKEGDYILNEKFKVVRKITGIQKMDIWNYETNKMEDRYIYRVKELVNSFIPKAVLDKGAFRSKPIEKVDSYYVKVDEDVVKALYGI